MVMSYDPGPMGFVRNNPYHDADGKFAPGPGSGGFDDDGTDGGGEPIKLASASGGGYQVAAYEDPYSDRTVIAVSEHGEKLGSWDDGQAELTVDQARTTANGLDKMARVGHDAPTPKDPHAFDDGPAVLGSVEDGGLRVTAFHDGGGDLVSEGGRFIQVSKSGSDWRDPLRGAGDGRLLDVDLADATGLAGALRDVVAGIPSSRGLRSEYGYSPDPLLALRLGVRR
jgi:hypothetical protein